MQVLIACARPFWCKILACTPGGESRHGVTNIFISYSSKNRAQVEPLVADLQALGHEVWFDKELSGGQVWWDQILEAIRACDLYVMALTPDSLESLACRLEYAYAESINKRILPVMLDSVQVNALPSALAVLQLVDFRKADRTGTIALSRALGKLPPAKPLPNPLPVPPAAPLSPLARLRDQIEAQSLDAEQQESILKGLKRLMAQAENESGARQLLLQLQHRPDLLEVTAREVNAMLSQSRARPSRGQPDAQAPRNAVSRTRGLLVGVVILILLAVGLALFLKSRDATNSARTLAVGLTQTAVNLAAAGPTDTQAATASLLPATATPTTAVTPTALLTVSATPGALVTTPVRILTGHDGPV
ncbi:MAG TPA: TIR domain-containing protein, partial [Aggregatilineales bacterium]|nr:TIR domain-containing protein [Aggregatilineales bacterium]